MFIKVGFELEFLSAVHLCEETQARVCGLAKKLNIGDKLQTGNLTPSRKPTPPVFAVKTRLVVKFLLNTFVEDAHTCN